MDYKFLILAIAGLLSNLLLALATFHKATPELGLTDTVKKYFEINGFYVIASFICTVVLSYLLNQDGGNELISILTGGNVSIEKPFAFYFTAYIMGFSIDYVLSILRKIINPLKITLRND